MASFTVYAKVKKMGKQKKESLEPVPYVLDTKPDTLRQLITGLVERGVSEYNERRDAGQLLPYLTQEKIAEKAESGKVSFGLRGGNDAVAEEAVANAIQSFEDGIYRVFAGDQELLKLDDMIPWTEDIVFTLIRLTMLSGW